MPENVLLDADAELIATLPRYKQVPSGFEDWVALGAYDTLGSTAEERRLGSIITHQVLHVPGTHICLHICHRQMLVTEHGSTGHRAFISTSCINLPCAGLLHTDNFSQLQKASAA